jgi:hypothetical protein
MPCAVGDPFVAHSSASPSCASPSPQLLSRRRGHHPAVTETSFRRRMDPSTARTRYVRQRTYPSRRVDTAGSMTTSCKGEAGEARRPNDVMVLSPSSSWLWACGQPRRGCPSPVGRREAAVHGAACPQPWSGAHGWTPAGPVCWDGCGPGWSGGWRGTPRLGKVPVPPAPTSPVRLIATSGPATDDPFEESGPIPRDRVRLQHMSGSRCRPLHCGTVAVEPATRQAAGTDDHTWGGAK